MEANDQYGHEPWYRHIAALGGVGNILLMMSANLVGFVLGLDGMKHLVVQLSTTAEGELSRLPAPLPWTYAFAPYTGY